MLLFMANKGAHTLVSNCIFLVNEQKYSKIFDIILKSVNNLGGVSTFA